MVNNSSGEPIHILLVEDNDAHAELVKRGFEQHRVLNRITHLKDGKAAIDFLFTEGEYSEAELDLPHIILLDLRLPKVDGLEVLKQIKSDQGMNKIPVVILSTSAAEQDVARAYSFHANSYLVKPMDYDKFRELMADLGYYWMAWNQDPWDKQKLNPELDVKDLL